MSNIPIQSKNDEAPMEKEFRIKGLMMDPASNSPIVLLQENEGTTKQYTIVELLKIHDYKLHCLNKLLVFKTLILD